MSTLTSKERSLLKALHDIALYQGHYASDKNPTVRALKKIAVDAIDVFHEPPTAHEIGEPPAGTRITGHSNECFADRQAAASAPETFPQPFHEGMRQSYLKALELSGASGMLGDGDKSDLLEMYRRLWPRAPSDIRENALKASEGPASCTCDENDMYCPHTSSEPV